MQKLALATPATSGTAMLVQVSCDGTVHGWSRRSMSVSHAALSQADINGCADVTCPTHSTCVDNAAPDTGHTCVCDAGYSRPEGDSVGDCSVSVCISLNQIANLGGRVACFPENETPQFWPGAFDALQVGEHLRKFLMLAAELLLVGFPHRLGLHFSSSPLQASTAMTRHPWLLCCHARLTVAGTSSSAQLLASIGGATRL